MPDIVPEFSDNLPAAPDYGALSACIQASRTAAGSADIAPELFFKHTAGSHV